MTKGSWLALIIVVLSFFYRDALMEKFEEMKSFDWFKGETELITGTISDKQRIPESTTRISHVLVVNGTKYIVTQSIYDHLSMGDEIDIHIKKDKIIQINKVGRAN